MTGRIRLLGLLLLAGMALTVAPHIGGMTSRIMPYLTGEGGEKKGKGQLASRVRPLSPAERARMQTSYEQDARAIEALDSGKKLQEVEALIESVKQKWRGMHGPHYGLLMLSSCRTLNSVDFGDKRQYELAYKNALEVLELPGRLPQEQWQRLEAEVGLVLCLNRDLGDPSWTVPQSWEVRRRSNAEKFLSLWQRMRGEIDHTFDPEDKPFLNVPAPAGSGVTAGTDPTSIKDPAVRAKYEADIEANRKKARNYNLQLKLRTMTEVFWPQLKGYLIAAYSRAPANNGELQELMSRYQLAEQHKAEINEALKSLHP